jgi:hypothetical protein
MEKIGNEPLPIADENDMCPMIAAAVLNKKGYEIPIPKANCMMGIFREFVNSALKRKGLQSVIYEGVNLAAGKLVLVKKQYDGILLMQSRSNPKIFHFIAFIVIGNELRFYDPHAGQLDVYRLKNNASATDFDEDFAELFPDYQIIQISLIQEMQGGKRITDPEGYKKKALQTLKDHGLTPMMVYTALLTKTIRKRQQVVSKMFGFKSSGRLANDHVLEVKNKEGELFRYKIGYERKNQSYHSLLAKAPGSFYTQIFTSRAWGYDSDRYYEEGFNMQEKRHLTRKLKLKPRYRKTRKQKV